MGDETMVIIMTVNRTSAISVNLKLLPVLWLQLKAVYSPTSFDQRKKAETNYHYPYPSDWPVKAVQLASLCTLRPGAGKIEILFQLS